MHDDMLSLAMFWAGALMAFAPLLIAAIVVVVIRRQRRARARQAAKGPESADSTP